MNIVLDLDETLIHTYDDNELIGREPDFSFKLGGYIYKVTKRPKLDQFINWIFSHPKIKTVNIWTAATCDYARNIIKHILTPAQRKKLHIFHTRKHVVQGTKPLDKIFNDKLRKNNTIMVDDRAEIGVSNPGNLIVIPAYLGDTNDDYLDKLSILINLILDQKIMTNPDESPTYLKDMTS